jgi:hypothetical protein
LSIIKAQGVSRIFLFGFPAFDAQSFTRCVSGLKIVVASGRLTIKAGGSSYASITILHGTFCEYYMLSRKNPALFQKPLNFRVSCNSVHHFFDRPLILYWSAFHWISEDCDTIGSKQHPWVE